MRNWLIRIGRLGMRGEIDDQVAYVAWMLIAGLVYWGSINSSFGLGNFDGGIRR